MLLDTQVSPEVPLAQTAIGNLRDLCTQTAEQLAGMAQACEEYADQVDATHELILELLKEVAQMVVAGVAVGIIVGAITAGAGAAASAGLTTTRIAVYAPRLVALIEDLIAVAGRIATKIDDITLAATRLRDRCLPFAKAKVRNERGSMRWLPDKPSKRPAAPASGSHTARPPGWLKEHEGSGHTLREHVGRTDDEMLERLRSQTHLSRTSTFDDYDDAERLVDSVLARHDNEIREWILSRRGGHLRLRVDFDEVTGRSVLKDGTIVHPTSVRVILASNRTDPDSWSVLTSFPD